MFKGGLGDLLKQAQELGDSMRAKQEEMAKLEFDVSVGGGMVKMRFNAQMDALSIHVAPELLNPTELPVLQDLVLSAVNMGIRQARQKVQEEMGKLTGGMKIPGFGP
ncbi:MAG: YbaB/EbfC family nucleoid-associated protein [Deltaproteobacteria bacterium]|nr:YbaB/EbfC family nucleoid-associated protein [Deltaproteobacteria bacterium]